MGSRKKAVAAHGSQTPRHRYDRSRLMASVFVLAFVILGTIIFRITMAASQTVSLEAEDGLLIGQTELLNEQGDSGGSVRLGKSQAAGSYEENLALLRSAAGTRNDDFINSPFRNTPSAQLNVADLTDPVGINSGYSPDANGGSFRTVCYFSHLAYDDPILFPANPGVAHLHMFFGNDEANAFSDANSILNKGSSTCHGHELNRTSYWAPAVFDAAGNVRIPERMFVYYKSFGPNSANTQVYPDGATLRKIGGNAAAESAQDTHGVMNWTCNGRTDQDKQPTIPPGCFSSLSGRIAFPQCWNGTDAWLPGTAHMSISEGNFYTGNCPASHPVLLPSIEVFLEYGDIPEGTDGWYIASDVRQDGTKKAGGLTSHSDWWGGWNKEVNQAWVSKCNAIFYNCGLVSHIGDNRTLKGWESIAVDMAQGNPDYRGVKKITPQQITQLCPGESDTALTDTAWCKARLQAAGPEVKALHEKMGHVSGVQHTQH